MSIENDEFAKNVIDNFLNMFIVPEVERRQAAGDIENPYEIKVAQILFYPDGKSPQVLLGSEVAGIANVKLKDGIKKSKGEPVLENEIEGLSTFILPAKHSDCGHATVFRLGNRWATVFDFTYNKGLSKEHIERAKEFFSCAKHSLGKEYYYSFIDNLFSAVELLAKSLLLSIPDKEFREKATHRAIHVRVNRFADLGNIDKQYSKLYNKLNSLRPKARYLNGDMQISPSEAKEMFDEVEKMIQYSEGMPGV